MIHKTLTILSLIGLLLSVGLWGVSYWEPLYHTDDGVVLWAGHGRGSLTNLGRVRLAPTNPVDLIQKKHLGFEWSHGFRGFETDWRPYYFRSGPLWVLGIPLWIPTLLFALILWFSSVPLHRRRKRKKLGLCLKCGYDLRASKDRCPECGHAFGTT